MNRVSILGAGIGREHLRAFRALPEQFLVKMVVDHDRSRIEEIREADSFRSASTIDAALNDPEIDLINICLPPHLHALIEAGIAGAAQVGAIETHWSRGADYYAVPWRGTWAGGQSGAVLGMRSTTMIL